MIKILIIMIMIATMTMMTIIPMMTSNVMELPSGAETVYWSLRLRFYPFSVCLATFREICPHSSAFLPPVRSLGSKAEHLVLDYPTNMMMMMIHNA